MPSEESNAVPLTAVADRVRQVVESRSSGVSVTAVDGPGGAGKSTLAARLSAALGGLPVVHTDDFASWDNPLDWWPRLIDEVLEPLAAGRPARYQRYNWLKRTLDDWIDVAGPHILLEGVSANRSAFAPYVAFAIWVETPRHVRLARGLERDGAEMLAQWNEWMAAEDLYVERDAPDARSDLVVSGESISGGDPDSDVVVLRQGRLHAPSPDRPQC